MSGIGALFWCFGGLRYSTIVLFDSPRTGIFTYSNFIAAAAYYPTFACTGDATTRYRKHYVFVKPGTGLLQLAV